MTLPTTQTVTRPRAHGYGVRLDDLYLRIGVAPDFPIDVVTAPLQAPAVNTASAAEDIRNEFGQLFSRSDFTGGEGLDFAHRRDGLPLDDSRFWASRHIDVSNPTPGEPAKIRLLPATSIVETSADDNLHLGFDGTGLVMAENDGLRRATNFTDTTPTFSDVDPHAGGGAVDVLDITNIGSTLYFALGTSGIHSRTTGGTVASLSTATTKRVWGVKRQLLASTGTTLDSVNLGTGAHTVLVTLPVGQEWLDVCDAGAAVLACASDGSIYALGFDTDGAAGGTLELKAATPAGEGEVPYALAHDGSFVHYTTRQVTPDGAIGRWYRATLTGDLAVADAVLLRQWGDDATTVDCCPRRIVATRDSVITGVHEPAGESFLWRYDRATTGVTRYLNLNAAGLVVDIAVVSGLVFATVADVGLVRQAVDGTFESTGWIMGPLGDLFTASPKAWAGALLDHDGIVDDSRIRLYYTTTPAALADPDAAAWVEVKNVAVGVDADETALVAVEGRYLAGMVRLEANTLRDESPSVRSFAFRAYPGPGEEIVTFSVNASDSIERPGRRRLLVRGLGDQVYTALKGREGTYAELELLRLGLTYRGVIEQVGTRIPSQGRSGAATDLVAVKFRGRLVPLGTAVSASSGAAGQMGLVPMGGVAA